MTITFSDLVKIYRQSEFIENSNKAMFCSNSEEDYTLLERLAVAEEETAIKILSKTVSVGETVELELRQPQFELGRLFDNFEAFIKAYIS